MKKTLKQLFSLLVVASMLLSLATAAVAVTEPTISITEATVDAEEGIKKLVFAITTPAGTEGITSGGIIFSYDATKVMPVIADDYSDNPLDGSDEDADYMVDTFIPVTGRVNGVRYNYQLIDPRTMKIGNRIAAKVDVYTSGNFFDAKDGMNFIEFYFRYLVDASQLDAETFQLETDYSDGSPLKTWYPTASEAAAIKIKDKANNEYSIGKYQGESTAVLSEFTFTGSNVVPTYPLKTITLTPAATTVVAPTVIPAESAETVAITAKAINTKDQEMSLPADAVWSLKSAPAGVTLSNTGVLTVAPNAGAGVAKVVLTSGGTEYTTEVTITRETPIAAQIVLTANGADVTNYAVVKPIDASDAAKTVAFAATAKDQYGDAIAADIAINASALTGTSFAGNTLTVNYGADNGTITVTATSGELTDTIAVTVSELVVDWSGVSTSTITYGQKVSNAVTLPASGTATANGTTYNGTFSVVNGNEAPVAGTANATVAFTITDAGEFKDLVITKEYTFTVNRATYNMNGVLVANKAVTYNGQPHELTVSGTLPSGVSVSSITYNGSTEKPVEPGTYAVTVTFAGDTANYAPIAPIQAVLAIDKANAIITAEATQRFTYDGTPKSAVATLNHDETALTYSAEGFVDVGEYTVTITAASTTHYKVARKNVTVIIEKAVATGFETVAPTATYTAKEAFDAGITSTADIKAAMNLPATAVATYANGTEEVAITWAEATENWNDKAGTYTFVGTATSDNLSFPAGVKLTATATVNAVNATITPALSPIIVAESTLASAVDYSDIRIPTSIVLNADGEDITITPVWSKTLVELQALTVGDTATVEVTNLPVWATVHEKSFTFSVTDKYPVNVTITLPETTYVYGTPVGLPTAEQFAIDDGIDGDAEFTFRYESVYDAVYSSETAPVTVGTYKVIAELDSDTHYGRAELVFEITPLDVTYQVNDVTKKYKDANPDFTGFATSALAYADTEADLSVIFECVDTTDFIVGQTATITATITNENYNLVGVTNGTLTVVKKPLAELGVLPVIAGNAAVGETLTATLEGVNTAEYDYQWYVDGTPVSTDATYIPVIADSNKAITVDIIAKAEGNYDGIVTSEAITVEKYAISGELTASISDGITGTPTVLDAGDTVTIDVSSINDYAELEAAGITFEYQWFVNGTAIAGETSSSITLAEGLVGTLTVEVTATGDFTGTIEHSLGEINKLALTGDITITLADGVISYTSTLPGTLNTDYTLAWYKNGEVIGTDTTYTITSADYGTTITLKATAIGDVYTGTVVSNELEVPAIAPSNVQITVKERSSSLIATFTADANGAEITEFTVTITDGTELQTVTVTPVNGVFTYTFKDLKNRTPYTIMATATNAAGTSEAATVTATPKASSAPASDTNITYTVKFNTNGGSAVKSQTISKNGTVSEPAAPTKEGYTFDGWYKDAGFTKAYDFGTAVNASFTLYAKWTKVEEETPVDPEDPEITEDPEVSTAITFADVAESDWYYDAVKYVVDNKLMNGVSEEEFAPNATLTRAMLVTVLYRNAGEPATNRSIPFADVDMGSYYASAVSWAKQNGIVSGVTENEFAPDAEITREQIATIMFRYAQYNGMEAITMEENLHFADSNEIADYAVTAMNWAVGKGLMKGKSETTINSKDNATRAEIATILQRFIESIK